MVDTSLDLEAVALRLGPDQVEGRGTWRKLLSNGSVLTGGTIFVILLAYAVFGPIVAGGQGAITRLDPSQAFDQPGFWLSAAKPHAFGTDHLGRDLFGLAALGLRTSILIGVGVVILSALLGWLVGAISGYVGGWLDDALGRVMDIFNAFPGILVALAIVTALGPSVRTIVVVLVLTTWVLYARITRAQVLLLRGSAFVEAAKISGTRFPKILATHLGLSTWPMLLSLAIIELPHVILVEATLSFLGFGIQPPNTSLGFIISDERDYITIAPWPITFTGLLLALLCVSFAMVGIGVRRVLDPSESS